MKCQYKLNENFLERNAMNFVNDILEIHSAVSIYRENGRRVNGKSRIGILSARFMQGETITVEVDTSEDLSRVKDKLNIIGTEV